MILSTSLDCKYDRLVSEFVQFLCDELGVRPRKIDVVGTDLFENLGMCLDVEDESYLIFVKETGRRIDQIFITIAHEMIHVKQYMTQELGRLLDEQRQVPYEERWWEQEAYERAVPLLEKFAKNLTVDH